ncbi:hypothetical protein PFZ55_31865, partial [Streptomyces sp. MS2A]|nr:hypothetical protein [Streptomyces sp. MS2A]
MTPSLRTARACRAAAVLLLASAGYAAAHHPWLALPGLYAAAVFAWCAAREGALHRRGLLLAGRAGRPAPPAAGPRPPAGSGGGDRARCPGGVRRLAGLAGPAGGAGGHGFDGTEGWGRP